MRLATIDRRAHLVGTRRAVDIATASSETLPADPQKLFARWNDLTAWARAIDPDRVEGSVEFSPSDLGNPVGLPRQTFAIGLNYADHADESGIALPTEPVVFTKFASCLTGPDIDVTLSGDSVDWEAELVVVIGSGGRDISQADAWSHVAGLSVGQDLSDRTIQWSSPPAQFSLGKSLRDFGPVGPWVISLEEIRASSDPDDLAIGCTLTDVGGTQVVLQDGRTSSMIFSIPVLIEKLSAIVELFPGDIIFTGTPAGVGMGMTPPTYLKPGQTLTTTIQGVGSIVQRFR